MVSLQEKTRCCCSRMAAWAWVLQPELLQTCSWSRFWWRGRSGAQFLLREAHLCKDWGVFFFNSAAKECKKLGLTPVCSQQTLIMCLMDK